MITEFILVSFAAMVGWTILTYLAFFRIPVRIAPPLVLGISYLMTLFQKPSVLIAFAATGGVAVIHKLIGAEGLEPLKLPRKLKKPEKVTVPMVGHRIPRL